MAAVSSEMDDVFTLEEEHRTAQKAFLGGKYVFVLLLTRFGKRLVKHHGASQLAAGESTRAALCTNRRLQAVANWLG